MTSLFFATQRFDAFDGERWENYVQWARIPRLTEVVSLDSLLCPTIGPEISGDDWDHNVHEDCRLNYFYDLDYLIRRSAGFARRNILGLYRNPESHVTCAPAPRAFTFTGYDLVEAGGFIIALTNCGGFPETFSNDELNQYGLISDFSRASEIRRLLPERNPSERHAKTDLFAIWRLNET